MHKKVTLYRIKFNGLYLVGIKTKAPYWSEHDYLASYTEHKMVADAWARQHGGAVEAF
jgi:hypothetical protein